MVSSLLIGCASEGDVEDGENDVFMTDDAKADAFGVEDWSPDGAAVLKYVSTATAAKLQSEVGLSERVAKAIVAQRATLTNHAFTDLKDLDDAKYVGATVFKQLLTYAADQHLFKTALRIPLVVEDGDNLSLLASYNDKARQAGVPAFARYTFVDADTKYSDKMDSYNTRLQAIATKLHTTIPGEMLKFAYGLYQYETGSAKVCFVGDPTQVADTAGSQADSVVGDMYSIWAWRYGTKKWQQDDSNDPVESFGDDWKKYSTTSKFVRLIYTNDDDGTHISSDDIGPCR